VTVDAVAIAEQIGGSGGIGERLNELLGRPRGGGMLGDVEVKDGRRWWASTTRTKRTRRRAVGTVKKSMATTSRTWLVRNVRQV
jgi:hypothetical protein